MKNNTINTYIPKSNKWNGIKITKSAIKQISYLIKLNSKNSGIRLKIKKSGCAGFRYEMKLVQNKKLRKKEINNDITINYENILIYISSKDLTFFNGIKIDFVKNNINKVFKYSHPKIQTFCGCGESFSII